MAFMNGTLVNTPHGLRPIEQIETGASVNVASLGASGADPVWTAQRVQFSNGTADGPGTTRMVLVHFGDHQIACSPDQPFLVADGTLKRAERLIPGVDRLIEADGTHVTIGEVQWGEFSQGVHAIAPAGDYAGTLDGHLIEAGGVVCGDFVLQMLRGSMGDTSPRDRES